MEDIFFARSKPFTLGVELEFQVLDQDSFNLVSKAPALLAKAPASVLDKVAPEFLRSILEIRTGICTSVDEVESDLRTSIPLLEQTALESGCLLYSASLHPFAEPGDQILSVGERYQRIMDELQHVGRQFISQGMHVHVGVETGDLAVDVCDVLQAYLPVLLAISASSPYFRGEDTGLCSYRTKLFEALPLAGIAGYLGSWRAYVDEVNLLRDSQVIREIKDLWWDVRPSPGFGTVEIRVCDIPARFVEVLGLTSLIQALVAAVVEGRVQPERISPQLLRCNKWQAARHGLEGRFNDPLGMLPTRTQPVRQAIHELLIELQPFFDTLGSRGLNSLQDMLDGQISAVQQRKLMQRHGQFKKMIREIQGCYWNE